MVCNSCVLLIKGMLQTGNIDEAHEIHFIAEEVLEIASNLRVSLLVLYKGKAGRKSDCRHLFIDYEIIM